MVLVQYVVRIPELWRLSSLSSTVSQTREPAALSPEECPPAKPRFHSGKLAWRPKRGLLYIPALFKGAVLRFHVGLPECAFRVPMRQKGKTATLLQIDIGMEVDEGRGPLRTGSYVSSSMLVWARLLSLAGMLPIFQLPSCDPPIDSPGLCRKSESQPEGLKLLRRREAMSIRL